MPNGINIKKNSNPLAKKNLSLEEIKLIKKLISYPYLLFQSSYYNEPHRLINYLEEISSDFHSIWNKGKDNNIKFIVEDDLELTNARMSLVKAVALTIRKGLSILKIGPIFEM